MKSRNAQLAIVLIVWVGLCCSLAFALPPMGPPKAMLGEHGRALGFGYAYEQLNLEATGKSKFYVEGDLEWSDWDYTKYKIEDLTSNVLLGSLGYGLRKNLDISALIGMADATDEVKEPLANGSLCHEYTGFDSNFEIIWGFGTKVTFWANENISWGGLFQMLWSKFDSSDVKLQGDSNFSGDVELDFWEMQIAVGPTVKLDKFSIYGGPFLHLVSGDLNLEGSTVDEYDTTQLVKAKGNIKEESKLGGYGGLQWNVSEEICCFGEYQYTADASSIATGLLLKF